MFTKYDISYPNFIFCRGDRYYIFTRIYDKTVKHYIPKCIMHYVGNGYNYDVTEDFTIDGTFLYHENELWINETVDKYEDRYLFIDTWRMNETKETRQVIFIYDCYTRESKLIDYTDEYEIALKYFGTITDYPLVRYNNQIIKLLKNYSIDENGKKCPILYAIMYDLKTKKITYKNIDTLKINDKSPYINDIYFFDTNTGDIYYTASYNNGINQLLKVNINSNQTVSLFQPSDESTIYYQQDMFCDFGMGDFYIEKDNTHSIIMSMGTNDNYLKKYNIEHNDVTNISNLYFKHISGCGVYYFYLNNTIYVITRKNRLIPDDPLGDDCSLLGYLDENENIVVPNTEYKIRVNIDSGKMGVDLKNKRLIVDNTDASLNSGLLIYDYLNNQWTNEVLLYDTIYDGEVPVNHPPTTPSNLYYKSKPYVINTDVELSWTASTDEEEDTITYFVYFYQNDQWVAVGNTTDREFIHTIPMMDNADNCKYKIRAYDGTAFSDWCEGSNTFSVVKTLSECGLYFNEYDDDLGDYYEPFDFGFILGSENEDNSDVYVSVYCDDMFIQLFDNITMDESQECSINESLWNALDCGSHTITIQANNKKGSIELIYTFNKCIKPISNPIISGKDSTYGNVNKPFSQNYYVDDENQESKLKITVYINNEKDRVLNTIDKATRNKTYNIDITQSILDSLEYGVNKIVIKLEGSYDNKTKTVYRIYTFYKDNGDNYPPVISGVDTNLGEIDNLLYNYTVDDVNEADILTTTIYLNDHLIDCIYNSKRKFGYTLYIPNNNLYNGCNLLEIVVNDGYAISRRILQFTKAELKINKNLIIDLNDDFIFPIECKQGDSLKIKASLPNIKLTDYSYQFNVRDEHDKTISYNNSSIEIQDDMLTIVTDSNITKEAGIYYAELVLIDSNNNRIGSNDIILHVRKGATK